MVPFTLDIKGRLLTFDRPQIMGIINVTPDSFYAASRTRGADEISRRAELMMADGADMIDLGAYSSRPGASDVTAEEEIERLAYAVGAIRKAVGDMPLSVDTFRAGVARIAIAELGADIINDISGGEMDPDMFDTAAELKAPYILMHMRGTPATMQSLTDYSDVTSEVTFWLAERLARLEELGVNDVIVDPGFGFAKTVEQNYRLLHDLPHLAEALQRPILVGISRKSMLTRPLAITPDEALEATTACNTLALTRGAAILRVHDVKAARQALTITTLTEAL